MHAGKSCSFSRRMCSRTVATRGSDDSDATSRTVHSSATMSAPLPPGRMGLPYAGETLALLRNPFAFLEKRRARYGDVFKSRVLGRNVVFLAGAEGAKAFYDEANVSRERAHPYPIVD